jgi:hypothetical protein
MEYPSTRCRPFRSRIVPAALVVLGLSLLAGCFYIPGRRTPIEPHQIDPTDVLGDRPSNKRLRPGTATKAAVISLFGRPARESANGRVIGYVVPRKGGLWIAPLCFATGAAQYDLAVRLEFDAAGVLTRYEMKETEAPKYLYGAVPQYVHHPTAELTGFLDQIGPEHAPKGEVKPMLVPPATPQPVTPNGQRYETPTQ